MQAKKQSTQQDMNFLRKAYNNPEGKILIVGVFLFLIYSFWLGVVYIVNPVQARAVLTFSITRVFIGNPAGIFLGYTMRFSQVFILLANMYIETTNIFIFYPLLSFMFQGILKFSMLNSVKQRILRGIEIGQGPVKKYGVLGLFIFTLFPIWGKGPIVGALIGSLMKLKLWVNMGVVLSATYLVTLTLTIVFKKAHGLVLSFNPMAPVILILAVFAAIIGINFIRWRQQKIKGK